MKCCNHRCDEGREYPLREELDHIPDAGKMVKVLGVPVSIAQILRGFPLLDDEGIDEEENYWKWALHQDRKLLRAMLTALQEHQNQGEN